MSSYSEIQRTINENGLLPRYEGVDPFNESCPKSLRLRVLVIYILSDMQPRNAKMIAQEVKVKTGLSVSRYDVYSTLWNMENRNEGVEKADFFGKRGFYTLKNMELN